MAIKGKKLINEALKNKEFIIYEYFVLLIKTTFD